MSSDYATTFQVLPVAALILNLDLHIQDANRAFVSLLQRERDELVGRYVFDAFPENPADPDGAGGVKDWKASLRHVFESREEHQMGVQRYDVSQLQASSGFVTRYWWPTNTPMLDAAGELTGILHTVEEVTGAHEELKATLEFYRDEIASQGKGETEEAAKLRFADYAKVAMRNARLYPDLVAEVEQLREALTSRATIEQAKGIVMAEHQCSQAEAFQYLVRASQTANVKVREIAANLVAEQGRRPAPQGEKLLSGGRDGDDERRS